MSRTAASPAQIDIEVGARIRARRKLLGLSQSALANELGITFQQVQKYEKGTNRVGSSRLQHIAKLLGTTPSALFGEDEAGAPIPSLSLDTLGPLENSPEGLALNKAFMSIRRPAVRKSIIALIRALARDSEAADPE